MKMMCITINHDGPRLTDSVVYWYLCIYVKTIIVHKRQTFVLTGDWKETKCCVDVVSTSWGCTNFPCYARFPTQLSEFGHTESEEASEFLGRRFLTQRSTSSQNLLITQLFSENAPYKIQRGRGYDDRWRHNTSRVNSSQYLYLSGDDWSHPVRVLHNKLPHQGNTYWQTAE